MKAKIGFSVLIAVITLIVVLGLISSNGQGASAESAEQAADYRLQGEIHKPDGTLYTETVVLFFLQLDPFPSVLSYTQVFVIEGQLDTMLPEGLYNVTAEPEPEPYFIPRTKIDLRSDITGLVITSQVYRKPPAGDAPPNASLIAVGAVDAEGYVVVTGAPGTVPGYSAVAVANLSAGAVAGTAADASGAFTVTSLYAPPGSALLVKYDLDGDRVVKLWEDAQASTAVDFVDYMITLPGTIVMAGDPQLRSGATQPFSTVGGFWTPEPKQWAGWWLSGTLQTPAHHAADPWLRVVPGEVMTLTSDLRITSSGLSCSTPLSSSVLVDVALHQSFGGDGRADPWGMDFHAYLFTPTGLPINGGGYGETIRVAGVLVDTWTCVSDDAFSGSFAITFTVPITLAEGTYLPRVLLLANDVPLTTAIPIIPAWYHESEMGYLPPLRVGDSALPRIPWSLLADYPVNGHRGVQAREDAGYYQIYPWVVFPPEEVVIPRIDARTGEPIPYRLEPGAHWLSATDRRLPNPPHIPLDLPSGYLLVEVLKPDGFVDTLGPATVRQPSVRTPATPGGDQIGEASGHLGDVYHISTMSDTFWYVFDQYGRHTIFVLGEVDDIYGNTYLISATYDVDVAHVLDLDPAQLPTTPYVQGDAFAPGLHIFPPVPADVTVRLLQMPYSDPAQAFTTTVTGQANRFGYFQPPAGTVITMMAPGEFRVDITAVYTAPDGTLWMGSMRWGNVVEGSTPMMEAHGRRGMDYWDETIDDMPAWFEVDDLVANRPDKVGIEVYYPYWSGDVHWGLQGRQPGDSIHPIITIRDLGATGLITGPIYSVLRANGPRTASEFRRPPSDSTSYADLVKRIEIGEAPLFISTRSGRSHAVYPEEIDQWGYWYGTSQRPDVRVREILSQDMIGVGYWRFDDTYGYQIGEPADGDQPGDIKWEFGGAVLRTITDTDPLTEYAIYSSLWVLLPDGDSRGARVTPPFQDATGASINGGPILTMTVEGEVREIDVLFLPKGVRPGDVLEVGDVIAFSGHVGPPLDSRVEITITSPSSMQLAAELRANKIGWVYDPGLDFVAEEAGRWTVDVFVVHDRPLAYAGIPGKHNTGTVMGTLGRYEFYVVEPGSLRLFVTSPEPGFITWPEGEIEPIHIRGFAPPGTTAVHYTIHDKGVVMGQGSVAPGAGGAFTVTYDAETLHESFSMLSLTAHEGRWEGLAGEVAINLLAVGGEPRGNTVTLIGEEVFVGNALHRVYLPLVIKE